jgi:hypothetical protein
MERSSTDGGGNDPPGIFPSQGYVSKFKELLTYVVITTNISVSREVGNTWKERQTGNWWQMTAQGFP